MATRPPRRAAGIRLPLLLGIAAALALAVHLDRPDPDLEPTVPVAIRPALPAPIARPMPPPPAPAPPPAPIAPQRGNIPGLSVNATFATRSGGGSILVTRPDGSRALIPAGGDAVPGVRLVAVAADRATFAAGGATLWLPLLSESASKTDATPATPIMTTATVPPPPPPPPALATETQLRESQAYQAALAPRLDGPWRGYAVRGTTPLFAKAGLKPGNVITGINGRAFDRPQEIAQLTREAALSSTIVFQIRRDGKTQELRVEP